MSVVPLRLASLAGRAQVVLGPDESPRFVDVEHASEGALPFDPMACLARLNDLRALNVDPGAGVAMPHSALDCPVPRPRQIFAIGLNYRDHAAEMGSPLPSTPLVFTKFVSALAAPWADVPVHGSTCDYEAEVVVVVGSGGRDVPIERAWDHVAGLCVGQDLTDRELQYAGTPPQFSLGKSRRGFAPIGPWVVDARDLPSRDALAITCDVNGDRRQDSSMCEMVFGVAEIVSYLSGVCELYPGDVVYTGSPAGVGHGRDPRCYLAPGDVLTTRLEGVGTIVNRCV
jgi:2,4-diketo-3-deoxy-L-fuconate hydrolase